eukprot:3520148-Alexandrium_andersonii.AAC.1
MSRQLPQHHQCLPPSPARGALTALRGALRLARAQLATGLRRIKLAVLRGGLFQQCSAVFRPGALGADFSAQQFSSAPQCFGHGPSAQILARD